MQTIKINKSDWSGENAKVRIYADGSFGLYNGRMKFRFSEEPMFLEEDQRDDLTRIAVFEIGRQSEHPVIEGWRWDDGWCSFIDSGTEREGLNMYVVAAQLLFNIL